MIDLLIDIKKDAKASHIRLGDGKQSSFPLDGELWMGRNQFSAIVSIVKTKDADKEWKKIQYMIFDAPQVAENFEKRLAFAKKWFKNHPNPHEKWHSI